MSKLYKTKCGDQAKHCEIVKKLEAEVEKLKTLIDDEDLKVFDEALDKALELQSETEAKDELINQAAKRYFELAETNAVGCEKIKKLEAENEIVKQEARLYRQLLRCMGDTEIDCVSDLSLDIKDWLAEIDKISQGKKPLDVFGCEQCPPEAEHWKCQLCKVLSPESR